MGFSASYVLSGAVRQLCVVEGSLYSQILNCCFSVQHFLLHCTLFGTPSCSLTRLASSAPLSRVSGEGKIEK